MDSETKHESFEDLAKSLSGMRERPLLIAVLPMIDGRSPRALQQLLHNKQFEELDILLHSPGGDANSAFHMARLLKNHASKINGLVPIYAKSACTLLCLCMDRLILGELAELGPLDTQVARFSEDDAPDMGSALEMVQAMEQIQEHLLTTLDLTVKMICARGGLRVGGAVKLATQFVGQLAQPFYSQIEPIQLGQTARALDIGKRYGELLLKRYRGVNTDDASRIADRLVNGYPSHSFILDVEELQDIGLPAEQADAETSTVLSKIAKCLEQTQQPILSIVESESEGASAQKGRATGIHDAKAGATPSSEDGQSSRIAPNPTSSDVRKDAAKSAEA